MNYQSQKSNASLFCIAFSFYLSKTDIKNIINPIFNFNYKYNFEPKATFLYVMGASPEI